MNIKEQQIIELSKDKIVKEIANIVKCSIVHVRAIQRKHNIDYVRVKKKSSEYFKEHHDEIMKMLKTKSVFVVSKQLGFSQCSLHVYLKKHGILPPKIEKPNRHKGSTLAWSSGKKTHLKPTTISVKKLRVYPLPEAGQCKFYNDNMELCTNSIDKGVYCKEHNNICYKKGE